jgi:hypothetical protein
MEKGKKDFDRALEHLGGEVFGHDGRFVRYYADETSSWYRVNRGDVARLGRMLREDEEGEEGEENWQSGDTYSLWCAATRAHEYVRSPY